MNANACNRDAIRVIRAAALAVALTGLCAFASRADELKDARTALAGGNLDQAQQLFEKAAAQGLADGAAGVGQVALRRRDWAKAQEAFEKAQKMDPNLAMAWYGLGEVHRLQFEFADAIEPLQKAVEIDRKFPEAQLALGDALAHAERYADAIAALTPGINWGAKWKPRFLVALGNVEMARDSLRDAGIYFTQAQQEAPENPETNRALGEFYLKRGIGALAIQSLEKAVELDTSDVQLAYSLGKALEYDERSTDALERYKWVVERDSEYPEGQYAIGNLYYRAGPADPRRYADARPHLEKYTQLRPKDPKGWSYLGRDYYYLHMRDEAVTAMNKAVELGEKSKDMYTTLGRCYVELKNWSGALDAYAKGDPNTTDQLKIGQMFVFQGNIPAADSVYRGMIDRDSTSWEGKFALIEMAKLRFRQKDYAGTVGLLQRRIALDPNSDEAYYYMGLSLNEMKQLPDAAVALRQACGLAPNKADRWFRLGLVLASMDSVDASNEALTRATEIDSTSRDAAVSFRQLGYRALLAKDWGNAVNLLERSAAINANDVQTLVWLAQGYANAKNFPKAIENFRKVRALQPDNAEAAKGLKALGG